MGREGVIWRAFGLFANIGGGRKNLSAVGAKFFAMLFRSGPREFEVRRDARFRFSP